jgi:hypothetical protein
MYICSALFLFFRSLFVSRISLATETLVLRQQLLVLNRTVKRPKLRRRDRHFLVCLSRLWGGRREALIIVKPDTVINWHREGFRLYWRWKSDGVFGTHKSPQEADGAATYDQRAHVNMPRDHIVTGADEQNRADDFQRQEPARELESAPHAPE